MVVGDGRMRIWKLAAPFSLEVTADAVKGSRLKRQAKGLVESAMERCASVPIAKTVDTKVRAARRAAVDTKG